MSRLTCKYDGQNALRELCSFDRESDIEADDCLTCEEYCDMVGKECEDTEYPCDKCAIQKAFDKLAEYEELEEKGLLLKLPVGIGQEVYRVNSMIIPMTVTEITYALPYKGTKPIFLIKTVENKYKGEKYYFTENIGKIVFLTKEEAEQTLKRMESAE